MSESEISIEIAKHMGWIVVAVSPTVTVPCGYAPGELDLKSLPDYTNDLNAMNDAERLLNYDQWRTFLGFVMGDRIIPGLASLDEFHRAWHSSPKDQAEAFLKTLGKWKYD